FAVTVEAVVSAAPAELLGDGLGHFQDDTNFPSTARPKLDATVGRSVVAATRVQLQAQVRAPFAELAALVMDSEMARAATSRDARRREQRSRLWQLRARSVVE